MQNIFGTFIFKLICWKKKMWLSTDDEAKTIPQRDLMLFLPSKNDKSTKHFVFLNFFSLDHFVSCNTKCVVKCKSKLFWPNNIFWNWLFFILTQPTKQMGEFYFIGIRFFVKLFHDGNFQPSNSLHFKLVKHGKHTKIVWKVIIKLFISSAQCCWCCYCCCVALPQIYSLIMYGGVGGGGNAWMKIMGIGGDQAQKRQAQKGKKDVDKVGG